MTPDFDLIVVGCGPAGMMAGLLFARAGCTVRVLEKHGDFFRDIRPVNTIMQISRFIDPDWLVEIEADAVVDVDSDKPKRA